jgi:hypothetical protein
MTGHPRDSNLGSSYNIEVAMVRRTGNRLSPYYYRSLRPGIDGVSPLTRWNQSRPFFKTTKVSYRKDVHSHTKADNPNTDVTSDLDTGTVLVGTNLFTGSTNPLWKYQVLNDLPATTAASGTRYDYSQAWVTGEKVMYSILNRRLMTAELYGHPAVEQPVTSTPPDASTMSKTDDRAKRKFLDKLDSALSSVELGQDLGEYKETVHGVTNPLKGLRDLSLSYLDKLTKARRSFPRDKIALSKALADSYLEWTFGWKPLALDIADAIVGLQNRAQRFARVPIEASANEVYFGNTANVSTISDSFSFLNLSGVSRNQCSYSVRYKGSVKVDLVNGSLPVNRVLQLDLPHFIPTVWDLIPYSFVVDYFTNVGDIIRAYSARTNNLAWVNRTTRTVYRNDTVHTVKDSKGQVGQGVWTPIGLREDGQNSWSQRTDFTRVNYPPGNLNVMAFHFELPNSEKPWENIAALLLSRLKPLVPFFRL